MEAEFDKVPEGLDCEECWDEDVWADCSMDFVGFEVHSGDAIYKCPICGRLEAGE